MSLCQDFIRFFTGTNVIVTFVNKNLFGMIGHNEFINKIDQVNHFRSSKSPIEHIVFWKVRLKTGPYTNARTAREQDDVLFTDGAITFDKIIHLFLKTY